MESSCPVSGSGIFKDTMNTFSTTLQDPNSLPFPADANITHTTPPAPISTRISPLAQNAAVPGTTANPSPLMSSPSSPSPTAPSMSISPSSSPSATPQQPSPTPADSLPNTTMSLVHNQQPTSDTTITNSEHSNTSISNRNVSTDSTSAAVAADGMENNATSDVNNTTSELAHTSAAVQDSAAEALQGRRVSSHAGGKALGFLGSLSPKARQKTNKGSKKDSRPSSFSSLSSTVVVPNSEAPVSPTTQPFPLSRRKSLSAPCPGSQDLPITDLAFPAGTVSKDLQDPPPHCKSSGHPKERNESRERPRKTTSLIWYHGPIWPSFSLGPPKSLLSGRRKSVDVPSASSLHSKDGNASGDKEKKGGLISHFVRPRVTSGGDSVLAEDKILDPASRTMEGRKGASTPECHGSTSKASVTPVLLPTKPSQHDDPVSVSAPAPPPPYTDLTTTQSSLSFQSGYRPDQEDDTGTESGRRSWFFYGRHSHGRASSGSGKSLVNSTVFKQRRGSWQMPSPQTDAEPQSSDILKSSEVHPHSNPIDVEKQDVSNQPGNQEACQIPLLGETPSEQMKQQAYGTSTDVSSLRVVPNSGMDPELLHGTSSMSASNSSIYSNVSNITAAANARPSSRLGRLSRFRFPSIHKNKTQVSLPPPVTIQEPVPSNVRRGSLPALTFRPPAPEQPARRAAIPGSGSSSTFASASTAGNATVGDNMTSGSSSHNSINHGADLHNGIKASRNTLTEFLEEQSHHPHHSSTTLNSVSTSSSGMFAPHHRPVLGSKEVAQLNALPQHHKSGLRNFFGSERSTSSTSGSRGNGHAQYQSNCPSPVQGDNSGREQEVVHDEEQTTGHGRWPHSIGAFRASLPRRTSRRTVSASHIASNPLFMADVSTFGEDSHHPKNQQTFQSSRHSSSESDIQLASFLHKRTSLGLELSFGESDSQTATEGGGSGSVGQYLFGDELTNLSFGETKAKAMDSTGKTDANVSAPDQGHPSGPKGKARAFPLRPKNKSDPSLLSTPASSPLAAASTTGTGNASSPSGVTQPLVNDNTAAGPNQAKPLSPAAIVNSRMDSKRYSGYYSSPPSPQATTAFVSPVFASPSSMSAGTSSSYSTLTSYVTGRPLVGSNGPSASTVTAISNLGTAVTGSKFGAKATAYPGPRPNTASTPARNPNVPHMEPRSAIAEYSPMLHFKRQRSMSLQDADLLTADQFIALMPDDMPPVRRFSAEEADNSWHPKNRRIPAPDPAAILRSLLGTLNTKCGLIVKHLDVISVATPESPTSVDKDDIDSVATSNDTECVPVDPSLDSVKHDDQPESSPESNAPEQENQESTVDAGAECDAIDTSKDLVESVTVLFNELDHTATQLVDVMSKYILTDALSDLTRELDDMCSMAQQVFREDQAQRQAQLGAQEMGADHAMETSQTSLQRKADNGGVKAVHPNPADDEVSNTNPVSRSDDGHKGEHDLHDDESKDECMSSEDKQAAIRHYMCEMVSTAETSFEEFLHVYHKMFVLPINGYKIEGINDLKKVERTYYSNYSIIPAIDPDAPQPSLLGMSDIIAAERAFESCGPMMTFFHGSLVATGPQLVHPLYPINPMNPMNPMYPMYPMYPMNHAVNGTSSSGEVLSRARSSSESKEEWAALQKRKEMGDSAGVAGALSVHDPSAVGIGMGRAVLNAGGVMVPTVDIAIHGDDSKEHMGHEAYYYRNWFLGREHRTFVGQVDGLGTVIISIIKDTVIPTDPRPATPRTSTSAGSSVSSFSTMPVGSPTSLARPELVHSSHSFYHTRSNSKTFGISLMPSPRPSSEAMRAMLATSKTAAGASASEPHFSSLTASGLSYAASGSSISVSHYSSNHNSASLSSMGSNHPYAQQRWQYRCIMRQKDIGSIRITLPDPDSGSRRSGKTQWKSLLQSLHPAITYHAASKLKKVQTTAEFEKELARFDETMLRFKYKFGVLLVHTGQTKEEEWFGNQMASSPRFQDFLESGVLGQKVALKGFDRFSAGLDTRLGEAGEYSYYDTWGEGFEIMYHVSTLLPYNADDRQQIQRKRHIGNDIICVVFVDGDQPFIPNGIKSQFLHIFIVIHPVSLPDGTTGYSVAVVYDQQVPEFAPPLPDPPIFKTAHELRAFLLCKMINGENAAYKAPRLIKPHARARSGMLETLVAKANKLAKEKDSSDKKLAKQKKAIAAAATAAAAAAAAAAVAAAAAATAHSVTIPVPSGHSAGRHQTLSSSAPPQGPSMHVMHQHGHPHRSCHCHIHQECINHQVHSGDTEGNGHFNCCAAPLGGPTPVGFDDLSNLIRNRKLSGSPGIRATLHASEASGSETATCNAGSMVDGDKDKSDFSELTGDNHLQLRSQSDSDQEGPAQMEGRLSPTLSSQHSSVVAPTPIVPTGNVAQHLNTTQSNDESTPSLGQHEDSCFDGPLQCCCCCCCCCGESCCGIKCTTTTDHPLDSINMKPVGSVNQPSRGVFTHRAVRSEASSPIDAQFPIAQVSSPTSLFTVPRRSLGSIETNAEKNAKAMALGMSNGNASGRSKSELDLLLTPIDEGHQPVPIKRSTAPIIGALTRPTMKRASSNTGTIDGHYMFMQPTGSPTSTIISQDGTIQSVSSTPHSMKGRAQNFLTTLVRRRASSNDTSNIGANTHLGNKLSASPLGTSSITVNYDGSSRSGCGQPCPHHHHHHCHQPPRQHSPHPTQPRQRLNTGPPQHPFHQDNNSPAIMIPGQPPRFKDGYILRNKTPPQINTSLGASPGTETCDSDYPHDGTPLSASTVSSSSSLYTSNSSLPSVPLRASTGGTGISPRSLRSFPSRDGLNRASFTVDRKRSLEMLGSTRSSPGGTPPNGGGNGSTGVGYGGYISPEGMGRKGSAPESISIERASWASTARFSSATKLALSSQDMNAARNRRTSVMDMGEQAVTGWRVFESSQPSTPSSLRPMGSRSSLGLRPTMNSDPLTFAGKDYIGSLSSSQLLAAKQDASHNASGDVATPSSSSSSPSTPLVGAVGGMAGSGSSGSSSSKLLGEKQIPHDTTTTTTATTIIPSPDDTEKHDVNDKIVKRAASEEQFQSREARLVRMTSLQDLAAVNKASWHH